MFSPTKLFVALLALSHGSSIVSGQINSPNASIAIGMATTLNKQVVFNETYDILWDGTEPRFVDVYVYEQQGKGMLSKYAELEGRLVESNVTEKPYRWTVDSPINSTVTIALVSNGVTRKDKIVGTHVVEINDLQVFASTPPSAPTSGASVSTMNRAGIIVAAAGVAGSVLFASL